MPARTDTAKSAKNGAKLRYNIDKRKFERYGKAGCRPLEVASLLGVSREALLNWVRRTYAKEYGDDVTTMQVLQELRAGGDAEIRLAQYNKAKKGDNTMLIWLGKNRLDQCDDPLKYKQKDDVLEKKLGNVLDTLLLAMGAPAVLDQFPEHPVIEDDGDVSPSLPAADAADDAAEREAPAKEGDEDGT